ncbi:hypothetical protein LOK49_LG06G01019 [Camellia lanceoleosa]|uniref:Uncharacterized protein n=1 Tax=Camellia lanceoleosa TaxID=1840588 RepID=A0ACC0HF94_9ERIC|nr:hypothetical protein LOK49_LG06G01019 [Camellia lanceoleosa]
MNQGANVGAAMTSSAREISCSDVVAGLLSAWVLVAGHWEYEYSIKATMISAEVFGALRDGLKKLNSVKQIQTNILESILVASFTIVIVLLILPCEYNDGNPIPVVIFKGLPSTFHAFVVCLVFAFTGSLSGLLIQDMHFLAKFCEYSSMACMTSALALLLWGCHVHCHFSFTIHFSADMVLCK